MTLHLDNDTAQKLNYQCFIGVVVKKKISWLKRTNQIFTFAGLLLLVACGDAETSNPDNNTSKDNPEQVKSVALNLSTTALDKQVFLGHVMPEVKAIAPCPFLSDETAKAIVKADWNLTRREASDSHCYWSKNIGFSIKVTVEPLAMATPVSERAYNLESQPILKSQSQPGRNATVLYDTAWDKEQAYAMSFEQDNKLVMIYVTGMATDAERLTAAAIEVAHKLPSAILSGSSEDASQDDMVFDFCRIWHESDIQAIIGTPMRMTTGKLDCKWETGTGESLKQIRVTIYSGKSFPWDSLIERGERDISGIGERALMEKKRKNSHMPNHVLMNVLYDEKLVTVTVTDTIADYEAVAVALSKNIDSRF